MAYTRPWTKTTPPGSQAANTADDEIRNLREDLEERIALFATGWSTGAPTDPIVPTALVKGNVVGKTIIIHHSGFEPTSNFTVEFGGGFGNLFSTADSRFLEHNAGDAAVRVVRCPLILPVGVTITELAAVLNRNGATNFSCTLLYDSFDAAPATTGTISAGTTANGIQLKTVAGPHVVAADRTYYLTVDFPASQAARFYAARIKYDTPSHLNTL